LQILRGFGNARKACHIVARRKRHNASIAAPKKTILPRRMVSARSCGAEDVYAGHPIGLGFRPFFGANAQSNLKIRRALKTFWRKRSGIERGGTAIVHCALMRYGGFCV
jgi:hypothetical protein